MTSESDSFDHVIVRAGSRGWALGRRLTEDVGTPVCLLEGGTNNEQEFWRIQGFKLQNRLA